MLKVDIGGCKNYMDDRAFGFTNSFPECIDIASIRSRKASNSDAACAPRYLFDS